LRDFRHLEAWHKAHAFTLAIHRITETFPRAETFGMSATLRRGAANVAMKIAEGCGRDSVSEYVACLRQARGLGMEAEYQLLLARDLQFIEPSVHDGLQHQVIEVRKIITGLIKSQAI
jgi:four helix bundle protein